MDIFSVALEVEARPLGRSLEFGDVPRPDLVGRDGQQLGLGVGRVDELVAAFARTAVGSQHTVHGAGKCLLRHRRGRHSGHDRHGAVLGWLGWLRTWPCTLHCRSRRGRLLVPGHEATDPSPSCRRRDPRDLLRLVAWVARGPRGLRGLGVFACPSLYSCFAAAHSAGESCASRSANAESPLVRQRTDLCARESECCFVGYAFVRFGRTAAVHLYARVVVRSCLHLIRIKAWW